jgi:hypothetical protein
MRELDNKVAADVFDAINVTNARGMPKAGH